MLPLPVTADQGKSSFRLLDTPLIPTPRDQAVSRSEDKVDEGSSDDCLSCSRFDDPRLV